MKGSTSEVADLITSRNVVLFGSEWAPEKRGALLSLK